VSYPRSVLGFWFRSGLKQRRLGDFKIAVTWASVGSGGAQALGQDTLQHAVGVLAEEMASFYFVCPKWLVFIGGWPAASG
jgi:hypothetical protein